MSSEWNRRREREWGPPGLETPTSVSGYGPLLTVTGFCLVVTFGVPWCTQNIGYVDLQTGNRGCAVIPKQISSWSVLGDRREPDEAATLQKWAARNPGRINKEYGAFCETLLHVAARWGREDLAAILIAAGANVEAVNELGERPLYMAAQHRRPTVVKLLLARGADVNGSDRRGRTPLHAAACGLGEAPQGDARVEVGQLLLAAGANVNARERGSGFTPLRCATKYDSSSPAMAALLLSHGADRRGAEEQTRDR